MALVTNTLLTSSIIVKEMLRLLKNNLVFAPLVWRNLEKEFAKKIGASVSIKMPYRSKAADGNTLVKKSMKDVTVTLTVDSQAHFALEYSSVDMKLSIDQFSKRYLQTGIVQLAEKIDLSIAATINETFFAAGTPGTQPTAFIDYANAAAKQTVHAVPNDGQRCIVVEPYTHAALSDSVTKLLNTTKTDEAFTKGYHGDVAEYMLYSSNNLPTHTVGAHGGTPLMNGATATGATSIVTDGWTASVAGLLAVGDIFTIAGVNSINPSNYQDTGELQQFVVTATAASDGSGNSTISISPEINDGSGADGAEGYQTVTALPADNAAITVAGTASTTYKLSYAFHKEAIALAIVPLDLPETAGLAKRIYDKKSGIAMSLTGDFNITDLAEIKRVDILWGVKMIRPELAMRVWGAVH